MKRIGKFFYFSFQKIFCLLIRFYQTFLSPMKPPVCRFTPSCSRYAYEAIMKYGPVKGLFMAIWRVLRCNPFCKGGYDPVP
ncbi:MAG: membrane protein insertion efficiency factor YidD [Spirochaetaceae bacterium]|nr:membrane protein insertion efficiency factor YidD [Spirochaetaceae bacterium]